ncbi:amidohydrolase family protein [Candidatus Bathyarchaeota archaeon]|nr:amidohydrolase family protein [Candidatus Bathyarchaeota archaeon]
MSTEFDFLIKNVTIVEGTGKKAYFGNIGILGEKVHSLGEVKGDAKKEIDGKGLTAVPGFVDSHSHNDGMLLYYPNNESYVMQGVTSFVGGQCGSSPAPLADIIPVMGRLSEYLQEYVPYKYYPSQSLFPKEQVNAWMKEKFGWTIDWSTMGEYFQRVEAKGTSMNYVPLLGHRMVRYYVLGENNKRVATKKEVEEMGEVIRKALEDRCIGMSVGLDYDPDVFADRSELVEHVSILNDYPNAIFCPHSRRTGRRRGLGAGARQHDKIDGLNEIIDICRASKVKMNLAHIYTGWYIRPEDSAPEIIEEANRQATLDLIDKAIEEGLDITYDSIPSLAIGGFENLRYLCSLFAPWLREFGSPDELAKWLKVADYRSEIKEAISTGKIFWRVNWNPNLNPQWATNITIIKSKTPNVDDKTIAQIAAERKKDEMDTVLDLIAEDPYTRATTGTMKLQSTKLRAMFYKHPKACVGLDTSARDDKYEGKYPPYGIPASNTFDAFPRFFIQFVRDEPIFTLEEAVMKTSTQAAKVHALKGRGTINEGSYADIVLMDLPGLQTPADVMEPRRYPKGIDYVFVNGVPVVEKGVHTKATPGKVLRRE